MMVVFSVNGSLASYSIEFKSADHVIAKLAGNGEGRQDIPEEIEFFCSQGTWTSETVAEDVKKPIIKALVQSEGSG
jgi:hypothetical protein